MIYPNCTSCRLPVLHQKNRTCGSHSFNALPLPLPLSCRLARSSSSSCTRRATGTYRRVGAQCLTSQEVSVVWKSRIVSGDAATKAHRTAPPTGQDARRLAECPRGAFRNCRSREISLRHPPPGRRPCGWRCGTGPNRQGAPAAQRSRSHSRRVGARQGFPSSARFRRRRWDLPVCEIAGRSKSRFASLIPDGGCAIPAGFQARRTPHTCTSRPGKGSCRRRQ